MKFLKKFKYIITIILFIGIILYGYFIKISLNNNNEIIDNDLIILAEDKQDNHEEDNKKVFVDIKGAVKKPGVYSVDSTAIINDVINIAGGLNKNADTSLINLSKVVSNEMVIIIYTKEEVKKSNIVDTVIEVIEKECICPNIQNDGCINNEIDETIDNLGDKLVNINTASLDELMTIPGIGKVKAEAIIAYREVNKFKNIEDILNVNGFGNSLYEQIKIYITT